MYEAEENATKKTFAVKRIKKKSIRKQLLEREIEIMSKAKNPYILWCKEVFETDEYVSI